jgi:hypothetical protein
MDREAAALAGQLAARDVAKLPDRWYPALSAAKAGATDLQGAWDHLWFQAPAELVYQRREEGLPGLLALMDRDDSTYHHFVIVRLLRLAADGPGRDAILDRIRQRLTTLQHVWTRASVREVVCWEPDDSRPAELLGGMAEIAVSRTDGDTIGTYLREMGEEFPVHRARIAEQENSG